MGNLYEHTLTILKVKDLIILEPESRPGNDAPLKDKLNKLPSDVNPIDNPNTVFWWVDDQLIEKKNE